MHKIPNLLLSGLLALGTLAGCRTTSRTFHFVPTPLEVVVRPDGSGPVLARALVAIDRAVRDGELGPRLLVRLRIENESQETLELSTERLLLVGSDLEAFGPPEVAGDPRVPAGGTTVFELAFPYPAGMRFDAPRLTGVNLRFSLLHSGLETTSTATLERAFPQPETSDVQWSFGVGTRL